MSLGPSSKHLLSLNAVKTGNNLKYSLAASNIPSHSLTFPQHGVYFVLVANTAHIYPIRNCYHNCGRSFLRCLRSSKYYILHFEVDKSRDYYCNYLGSYAEMSTLLFGSYTSNILDEVNCTGSEECLIDCSHTGIGVHQCFVYASTVCAGILTFRFV